MKFTVALILTGLLAFGLGGWLEWWSIALAAFIVAALIPQRPLMALLSGFLGLFLFWGGMAFFINSNNDNILGSRVATILSLKGHASLLVLVTALIGGLVAGFAALAGSYLRAGRSA